MRPEDFFRWWEGQGRPSFTRAAVQAHRAELEGRGYSPSTINQRLAAIRNLAQEAAANGLLSSVDARQIAVGGGDGERLLHLHPTADQNSLIPGPGSDDGSPPIAVAAAVDSLISPGTSVDLVNAKVTSPERGLYDHQDQDEHGDASRKV